MSASTRAVLDGKEETLWKRNETSERLVFFGRTKEGLRDRYIPSPPYPDLCIPEFIIII